MCFRCLCTFWICLINFYTSDKSVISTSSCFFYLSCLILTKDKSCFIVGNPAPLRCLIQPKIIQLKITNLQQTVQWQNLLLLLLLLEVTPVICSHLYFKKYLPIVCVYFTNCTFLRSQYWKSMRWHLEHNHSVWMV